ncbi:MAG: hypothetical protein CVV27_02425, partial [Candidatus Melainabacteria bacterium HGW-Melainabacteria-1]
NNNLIDQNWQLVSTTQQQMEDLQRVYDEKMQGIAVAFDSANGAGLVLVENLKAIAPTLAEQASAAIASIQSIRDELNKPLNFPMASSASSSGGTGGTGSSTSNPDIILFREAKASNFTVQGPDGKWYQTTTQMGQANKLPGYKDGGVIPDIPQFENDGAVIRASAGERILTRDFNRRLENLLRGNMGGGSSAQYNSIHIGNISRDVDLNKLDAVLDKYMRKEGRQGVKRWGINSISRN